MTSTGDADVAPPPVEEKADPYEEEQNARAFQRIFMKGTKARREPALVGRVAEFAPRRQVSLSKLNLPQLIESKSFNQQPEDVSPRLLTPVHMAQQRPAQFGKPDEVASRDNPCFPRSGSMTLRQKQLKEQVERTRAEVGWLHCSKSGCNLCTGRGIKVTHCCMTN
jgi:hypothetical protein